MEIQNLTLEQAIEEHHKMWYWISDFILNHDQKFIDSISIMDIKLAYFDSETDKFDEEFKNKMLLNHYCFLCAYSKNISRDYRCSFCPAIWNNHRCTSNYCGGIGSPFFDFYLHKTEINAKRVANINFKNIKEEK